MSNLPKGGYGIISRVAMKSNKLSCESKALYALYCSYTGDKEYCWPSLEMLSKDLNKSIASIRRYNKELVKYNLLDVIKIQGQTNQYYPKFLDINNLDPYHPCNPLHQWKGGGITHDTQILTNNKNNLTSPKVEVKSKKSNELKIDEAEELIKHWNDTFNQKLILNKKEKGPVYGIIKIHGLENLKTAITRAKVRKDKNGINYTWGSVIYKNSNIADLLSEENKTGYSDKVQEALRKSREENNE